MHNPIKNFTVCCPDWYGWKNRNSSLVSIWFCYGIVATGYSKEFSFCLFQPFYYDCDITRYNGHARFVFGCGLFSFSFDWGYDPEEEARRFAEEQARKKD